MKRVILILSFLFSFAFAEKTDFNKYDEYFQYYGDKYNVSYFLLKAVAATENESMNPFALRHNTNGTRDIGLMQINTLWIKELPEMQLTEAKLYQVETNIEVAAIILSRLIKEKGYSWHTIGMYHSKTPKYKMVWLNRIKKNIITLAKYDERVSINGTRVSID